MAQVWLLQFVYVGALEFPMLSLGPQILACWHASSQANSHSVRGGGGFLGEACSLNPPRHPTSLLNFPHCSPGTEEQQARGKKLAARFLNAGEIPNASFSLIPVQKIPGNES